jgi:SAM-dependent methyltransferase
LWWHDQIDANGIAGATSLLLQNLWSFIVDSTPERRRQRYGDIEYDWEHRVNTTSGTVGWRERLLGLFLSPYQPTDPAVFHEMMASLPIKFEQFKFADLGSGKGRTLLMASDYPFRNIVGVELLPELHAIAKENLSCYKSESQRCFALETVCGDATEFEFSDDPVVLYLFNPLPESGLKRVMKNLQLNLRLHPRTVYVLYHDPLLESVLTAIGFAKIDGRPQYSIYAAILTESPTSATITGQSASHHR